MIPPMQVDPPELRAAGSTLTSAGSSLDSLGGSAPTGVDAGIMTATVTSALAKITKNAAALAQGLDAAGAKLHDCMGDYETCDTGSAGRFHGLSGNGTSSAGAPR